ncbi:MAG: hypothetical protein ACE5LU_28575 [Anaerolineae bacterium]
MVDGWVAGWVGGWLDGWMAGWVDGWGDGGLGAVQRPAALMQLGEGRCR